MSESIKPLVHDRKIDTLRRALRRLAGELGPDRQLPTVRELVKSYGVSIVTLDRALRELEVEGVLVRRHGVGVFVDPSIATHHIGLIYDRNIFEEFTSPFPRMLMEAANNRAVEMDEQFHLYLVVPTHIQGVPGREALIADVDAGRLDGVIYCGRHHQQTLEYLHTRQIPLVLMGISHLPIRYRLIMDIRETVFQAIRALIDKGSGKVAMLSAYSGIRRDIPEFRQDTESFWQACQSCNAGTADPAIMFLDAEACSDACYDQNAYQIIMQAACDGKLPFDGLFVTNDMATRGVLRALGELNITPGKQIQLASQANKDSPILAHAPAGVILLEYDPRQMAIDAIDQLEAVLKGTQTQPRDLVARSILRVVGE